jgi:hypothetical protein
MIQAAEVQVAAEDMTDRFGFFRNDCDLSVLGLEAQGNHTATIWRPCRHSDLGWTASPIRPDMIFGKDIGRLRSESKPGDLLHPKGGNESRPDEIFGKDSA